MFGISNFFGSYDDGYINCEFKRPTDIRINDDNIPANINRFQLLKDKYVVFLAEGTFRNGQILKHRVKDASAEPLVKFSGHFFDFSIIFNFFFPAIGNCREFGGKIQRVFAFTRSLHDWCVVGFSFTGHPGGSVF